MLSVQNWYPELCEEITPCHIVFPIYNVSSAYADIPLGAAVASFSALEG
jgi:hypothetical protein